MENYYKVKYFVRIPNPSSYAVFAYDGHVYVAEEDLDKALCTAEEEIRALYKTRCKDAEIEIVYIKQLQK